ncbi:MAG: hypothetical protein PHQ41_09130 [Candidatus Cloacimonetes bacterium]|nr:hypothetical protein [Candidatus Cloacimonadota bacterium]
MISIFIDHKLERFTREIRYSFDFIFHVLGFGHRYVSDPEELKPQDIVILYSFSEPDEEQIKALARHYITIYITCDLKLYEPGGLSSESLRRFIKEKKLLYPTQIICTRAFHNVAENYIDREFSGGKINFDLVGNVFYHLSSTERSYYSKASGAQRYDEEGSAFYTHRDTPTIDSLLWLLESMIKEHAQHKKLFLAQKCYWPEAQTAAVLLSHTVDDLQKWNLPSLILSIADDFTMLFTLKFRQLFHALWGKIQYLFTNYELYWNFDEFQELERENGCHSTFFLGTDQCDEIDYGLEDPDLQEEIQKILGRGHDIGLLLPNDKIGRDDMLSRKQVMLHQLTKDQVGIRQLHYTINPDILALHDKIGPLYSQSAAFKDSPGFYHGTSFPFYPWIGGKASYLNLPTTYRDQYLRVNKHKILALDDAKAQIKSYFQQIQRTHGIFALDFSLASYSDIHYCHKLYAYLLALVKSAPTWVCTARELSHWWIKRSRVTVEESDYEIAVYFDEDMDHFCLQIFADAKIKEIDGAKAKIDGNLVRFANVKAKSFAILRFIRP